MVDIRIIREAVKLSQGDLAELVGITRQNLWLIEMGKSTPKLETARRIVAAIADAFQAQQPLQNRHLDAMVREFLANPFGFTPIDPTPSTKRGPGRPKNEASNPSKKEPAAEQASAAACLIEPAREGVSSSLGENPPPRDETPVIHTQSCDFSLPKSAAKAWPLALGSRAERSAFIDRCFDQPWALRWSKESRRDKIVKALNKMARIKIRERSACEFTSAKREIIFNLVAPPYQSHRKTNWHSKGADDKHAFGSCKSSLKAVLETEAIRRALREALSGEVPSFQYCYDLIREKLPVDSYGEVKDPLQKTIGFRPAYDGHVLLADATGIPVRVQGAWGAKREGAEGNRRGFQKHWLHLGVDVASAHTWIYPTFSDNEAAGWHPFLKWLLLDQLGYVPEHLSVDQVSGVFTWLCDPDDRLASPNLSREVLLWLAAGCKPYIHQPKRPTGGAHAEVTVKGVKDEFNRITVRKALEKELAGHGLKIARHFDSQQELHAAITELRESVNDRHLARAGDTRVNLWNDAESAALRDQRALVSNARDIWEDIVDRTKVAQVNGNYLIGKSLNGQRITADLTTALDFKAQECPALVFPTGLRVGDDPEGLRVLIIQERQGQPIYHVAEAKAALKDKRGFDERKPIFGEGKFIAAPDTQQDQLSKIRAREAAVHRERVGALREGTTGEPVATRVYE